MVVQDIKSFMMRCLTIEKAGSYLSSKAKAPT
jgi:hypothetical protein